jgi:cobalt-zinc-cadmium efflux system outer membrane protein
MDLLEAQSSLHVARKMLAATWGAECAAFEEASGYLDRDLEAVPPPETLRARLAANPDLAGREAEIRLRQAALSAEKAARVPDLDAAIGYQRFEEDGTDSLAVGVGVPLPVFDRNQGNIAAAVHELAKAQQERTATEIALASELAENHATLSVAHQRVTTLRANVIPAMEQAFQAAQEGYRQGKYGFLDMLDAQRGLFEARGALIDALSDYHKAQIDMQRMTGTTIGKQNKGTQEDSK